MKKSRLAKQYNDDIRPALQKQLGLDNIMMVPKLLKIVLNVGVKEAVSDSKALQESVDVLAKIAGQRAVKRLARKSIAGFKLREGMAIGAMVTLRGTMMYEFLDRLISLALPKVRDFQGLPTKLDGRGSYNIGIKDWTVFPEVDFDLGKKTHGMNITIQTSAKTDEHGLALLKAFNIPFRKSKN
jgi:large subunit ribosomal protein L5